MHMEKHGAFSHCATSKRVSSKNIDFNDFMKLKFEFCSDVNPCFDGGTEISGGNDLEELTDVKTTIQCYTLCKANSNCKARSDTLYIFSTTHKI